MDPAPFAKNIDEANPTHGGYGATLFDPQWKAKRVEILRRDGNACVNCKASKNLQVHHRQYHFSTTLNAFVNPWQYTNNLLITLCKRCHDKGHRLYQVPVKKIK